MAPISVLEAATMSDDMDSKAMSIMANCEPQMRAIANKRAKLIAKFLEFVMPVAYSKKSGKR